MTRPDETDSDEEELLRSVAMQNARSIVLARQRAEQELITAKEALEARSRELESANQLVRTIAENAASCLLMLDERGMVTYMNPAAIEETGYSQEELTEAPFHDVLHPQAERGGHSADQCPIREARERTVPLKKYRDLFMRKDGSTFPVSCSLSPLQREGHAAGAVLEFRDITDEIRARKALEEASDRKDQFLATLSHELRTPMTAVLGWARMLKLGLSERETIEAIDAIEKSAVVQAQLIDDVLDVSRIVAGKMTFNAAPVDLGEVLNSAMTTVRPAASAKGIGMRAEIPSSLPRIMGDEGRLQQVIWNLLSNAVKFTPADGIITIRLERSGNLLRLTVEDTGKGIEPEYLPYLFEPFSQEDDTMTRSHDGIGLGLSIAKAIIELHGGSVRAASDGAGCGATFTVELPVMEPAQAFDDTSNAGTATGRVSECISLPNLDGMCLLVIDDNEFTRDLAAAVFRRADAEVHTAESVRGGLDLFESVMPDAVVCDLAMPGEDGFAFVKAVRAVPGPASATPVIALTAFGRPDDREKALAGGFDAYVRKPLDPGELASMVHRLAATKT